MAKRKPTKAMTKKMMQQREANRKAEEESLNLKNATTLPFSGAVYAPFADRIIINTTDRKTILLVPKDVEAARQLLSQLEDWIEQHGDEEEGDEEDEE